MDIAVLDFKIQLLFLPHQIQVYTLSLLSSPELHSAQQTEGTITIMPEVC